MKEEAKAAAEAKVQARAASQDASDVHRCGRCARTFLSNGWYLKHVAQWCTSRKLMTLEAQKERRVGMVLQEMDDLRTAAAAERKTKVS